MQKVPGQCDSVLSADAVALVDRRDRDTPQETTPMPVDARRRGRHWQNNSRCRPPSLSLSGRSERRRTHQKFSAADVQWKRPGSVFVSAVRSILKCEGGQRDEGSSADISPICNSNTSIHPILSLYPYIIHDGCAKAQGRPGRRPGQQINTISFRIDETFEAAKVQRCPQQEGGRKEARPQVRQARSSCSYRPGQLVAAQGRGAHVP